MVSLPSKRQQARNEKALQDLIKAVPGNDRCADCDARNPGKDAPETLRLVCPFLTRVALPSGWASWNVSLRYLFCRLYRAFWSNG
jgi:hypothetical protein